jgi:DNA-binding CsgD family transcriptional regulator
MTHFEELFVAAIYKTLKDRDREIIELRYGIGDSDALTLQEIGDLHGITRERVRQILQRAHRRLRVNGHYGIRKGRADYPAAQLIQYLRERLKEYGDDEYESIIEFVEHELPYLPLYTHSLSLINYLTIPQAIHAKARLYDLKRRASARHHHKLGATKQQIRFDKLLSYVIWPENIATWKPENFARAKPQRSFLENNIGICGDFLSEKLHRKIYFASHLERDFLLQLEALQDVVY